MADDFEVEQMLEDLLEEGKDEGNGKMATNGNEKATNGDDSNKRDKKRDSNRRRSRSRDLERKKSTRRSRSRDRKGNSRSTKRSKSRDKRPRRSRSRSHKRSDRKSDRKRSKSKERSKRSKRSKSKERERKKKSRSIERMQIARSPTPPRPSDQSSAEDRDSRTVLAMQLHQKTKEKDLKEFFSSVGDVRGVKMIQDRHSRRSKNIGIAYIEFKYSQSVPLALGLSGQAVNGIPIMVQQSQAEKNRHAQMVESNRQNLTKIGNGPLKLKVSSLMDELTEEMFRKVFEPFGRIESCKLIKDPITGLSSGTGFITFVDADSGKTAVRELDRFDLGGKRMRVSVLDDKKVPDVEPMSTLDDNMDGSVGRIALMNKLAQRADILMPKPVKSEVPQPVAKPIQPIQTRCFQLSNMFDPEKETEDGWENDIRDDVITEVSKFGSALHVYIDKHSKEGVVYIMASSNDCAVAASKKIHGTYFDSKMIQAAYIPEKNYFELFPDASNPEIQALK